MSLIKLLNIFLVGASVLLVAGCGQNAVNFGKYTANQQSGGGAAPDSVAWCEVNPAQFVLGGQVDQFGLTNSFGLDISYSFTGKYTGKVGTSLQFYTATLYLSGYARDPLSGSSIWEGQVSTNQNQNQIGVALDFSGVHAAPIVSFTDAVTKVATDVLKEMLKAAAGSANWQPWNAHIVGAYRDNYYFMGVNSNSGVKVGDEFDVSNVEYLWLNNNHCAAGGYLGRGISVPVGKAVVRQIDASGNALIEMTKINNPEVLPRRGSELTISKLPGSGRKLKYRVSFEPITSNPFPLPFGGTFDFGGTMSSLFKGVVFSNDTFVAQ